MRWITRRNLHIDRTSCPWLIRRHIDPAATFDFVAPGTDPATLDGRTFDMPWAEYSHIAARCTFEVTHIDNCPADNILTGYRAGQSGTLFQTQMIVNF